MRWSILAAAVLSSALAIPLLADEVQFKNGDKITGTIESMEGGKMVIKSKVAGKITVDMKDVKTFATDAPISIRLKDSKTTITQKVAASQPGEVALAPGGPLAPQAVPLAGINYLNFKEDWTGTITASGALSRGNTESENLNLAIHMLRRTENDRITVDAGYLYGRQRITTATATGTTSIVSETQNDWFIGGQYDYYFNEIDKRLYAYANAKLERDTISGISVRLTPGGGIGYELFDRPDLHFHPEGGLSLLYRDFTHDGGTEETVALRLAYHYDRKLADKVFFIHNFEYFPGLDSIGDYYFDTDAGIRATLTDKMFVEFKVQEQYESEPAPLTPIPHIKLHPHKGHNDTQFMLGVGWNF